MGQCCPACHGDGFHDLRDTDAFLGEHLTDEQLAAVHREGDRSNVPCPVCNGTGTVTDEEAERLRRAAILFVETAMLLSDDAEEARTERPLASTLLCPRCRERRYTPYGTDLSHLGPRTIRRLMDVAPPPALSRLDNQTYICSRCGTDEAMRDYAGAPPIPPNEWPITTG